MDALAQLLPPNERAALAAALAAVEPEPYVPEPVPAPPTLELPVPVRAAIAAIWPHTRLAFPAPNPRSVMRHDLPLAPDTLVGPKTDGERVLLFVTHAGVFLVNRALRVEGPSDENFGPALREGIGTVLDCERIAGPRALVAFDCYAHCGRPCHELGFAARINLAAKVRERGYAHRPGADAWELRVKRFVPLAMADAVLAARYDHPVDGLVMQPASSRLQSGMAQDVYKWKAHHTVDIALTPHMPPDVVQPAVLDKGRPVSAGTPFRVNLQALGITWERIGQIPPLVVECAVGALGEWLPIKPRHDKTDANDLFVVRRTLQNAREALRPADIMTRA